MKTRYLDFLKMNEANEYVIGLAEVEKIIKNVFDEAKVSSVKSLYDVDDENGKTKLIISMNNLFYEQNNILYTKFIFNVDNEHTKLTDNSFTYMYDINCKFKRVKFDSITSLQEKLNTILSQNKFGSDIKKISNANISLATDVNEWLGKNGVSNSSVYSIKYQPLVDNIPCESLFFKFEINIDDTRIITLNVKKNKDHDFKLSFSEGDWFHNVFLDDVDGIVQMIGETIKKHII